MIRVGNMEPVIHAVLPGGASLEHAVDVGLREVIMRADDIPVFRPGWVRGDGVVQDHQPFAQDVPTEPFITP